MSPPRQLPHHYSQPRPYRGVQQYPPSQAANYHNSYSNPYFNFQVPNWSHRQQGADTGARSAISMPDFSSLTNSDLVNALLAPSNNEYEQERQKFPLPNTSAETRAMQKRPHAHMDASGRTHDVNDQFELTRAHEHPQDEPNQRPRKQQRRKSQVPNESEDEYVDSTQFDEFSSPQPTRKSRRSGRPKKFPAVVEPITPEQNEHRALQQEQEEEKPKRQASTKKPKKQQTGRLIRKKPVGMTVPKTLDEAGPADRMMWEWKNQGKNWEEIRAEWKKITGIEPGGSSLSVRYIKLMENLARNGAARDIELLRFKKEAEEELMTQLWPKVAEKMLAFSAESEHNPKDLQKRYNMIVRSGYDVEKLLTDDEIKREPEQNLNLSDPGVTHHGIVEINDGEFPAYEDPAGNVTAQHMREQDSRTNDHQHLTLPARYGEQYQGMVEDTDNIFEPASVLQHEVDGLNERGHIENLKYDVHSPHSMATMMDDPMLSNAHSFTSQVQMDNHSMASYLPLASTLVDCYGSDSE